MADLPARSFRIGDDGIDCTLADRALIRACYRYYSDNVGREIARWEASDIARRIEQIRLSNMDSKRWRSWRRGNDQEARRG